MSRLISLGVCFCALLLASTAGCSDQGGEENDVVAEILCPGDVESCCYTDADCDDGDPCTVDTCSQGVCKHAVTDPFCCVVDSDCDDLSFCTTDRCKGGKCEFTPNPNLECCTAAECNDSNPCSWDICVHGKCVHPVDSNVPGCDCKSAADCEDFNDCTIDGCVNSACTYDVFTAGGIASGCCKDDSDCDDSDPTTEDKCIQFRCVNEHKKVCKFDADCDDSDPCTLDKCLNKHCVIGVEVTPGCCLTDLDCADDNPCTTESCQDNSCVYEPNIGQPGCCQSQEDCNDGIECTVDGCINFRCEWIPQGEGCCHDDNDCPPPTLPCQKAVCTKEGQCGFENLTNCCEANEECDDNDPCTIDQCTQKQCFYFPVEGCCKTDADCDDGNLCTQEKCVGGKCQEPKYIPGCCNHAGQCNDSDVCTIDKCVNNQCVYEEKPNCCHKDSECIPEIDCQIPHCVNGNCIFELGKDCCLTDADCDDKDDTCTNDSCVDNHCQHTLTGNEGCCLVPQDCPTPDPCQTPSCGSNHKCSYTAIPDCCHDDEECDDGDDLCTEDLCIDNKCVYTLSGEPGCCLVASDCSSPDICQTPVCNEQHLCQFEPVENCCHDDSECDDGDDLCTADACVDNQCVFTYTGAEGCCKADSDCTNPDPCVKGKCDVQTGTCSFFPIEGCCHDDSECDDGDDLCTVDTCVMNQCVFTPTNNPGCCEEFSWTSNFEDGTESQWILSEPMGMPPLLSIGWQVSGACGYSSPPSALYFGSPPGMFGGCTYSLMGIPIPLALSGTATSPPMELPPAQTYTLTFQVAADISPAPNADMLTLDVVEGGNSTTVWDKSSIKNFGPNFEAAVVDLSEFAGKKISLVFTFNNLGSAGSGGKGVLIDDVAVVADCNP